MFCISAVYPWKDGAKFDFGYYVKKHVPMVVGFLGKNSIKTEVRKGVASPDGSAPSFTCLASFWITSVEEFQATLAKHGPEIMGDIPNYTTMQPILQVDDVVG